MKPITDQELFEALKQDPENKILLLEALLRDNDVFTEFLSF